ncbi:hypothetical protein BDD12DRAFT_891912 [Trichophaea hybrida]|nr:hypothetical protein BDD12DRAFT_891912 [Trichophaea hybrida]
MSTETHTVMDPPKLYVKSATPTKEIGYASIGLALYTRCGNSSHRRVNGPHSKQVPLSRRHGRTSKLTYIDHQTYGVSVARTHYAHSGASYYLGIKITVTKKLHAMMIDTEEPIEFGEKQLTQQSTSIKDIQNEGLAKRDDRDGYKAPYETPYEMLHAFGKSTHDDDGNKISAEAKSRP